MPPTAATVLTPSDTIGIAGVGVPTATATSAASAAMWFGLVPITEHTAFPPAKVHQCWVYLTLNAEIALTTPDNTQLRALLRQERVRVSVDGQWLWWALRRKYPQQALAKLSGSDLIHTLAALCGHGQQRLLLLGSTPGINAKAVMRLRAQHPGMAIAGFAPQPYQPDTREEERALRGMHEAIAAFRPDYVVFGLGATKEQRASALLAPLWDGQVTGMLCFGGAIDMAAGEVLRAPAWVSEAGLEALYRVRQQPSRLWRLLRALRILPVLAAGRY
jgi:N-acetylglucosaminyldiphosphoundecaprenol N-acetyl-beta-D-mannosaminyltransferase